MAVALRELDRGSRPAQLRVVRLPAPAPTPRHVYWLRRALVLCMMLVLVMSIAGAIRAVVAQPSVPVVRTDLTVVVAPGQTLWDIARRYAPANRDLTAWAAEIAAYNDVEAQSVQPGTPLVIPLETAAVTALPER
jgi:LysM domain